MTSYQTARAKMIRHEKKLREQLEYITNELNMLGPGFPELCPSELASLIIKAASETQLYIKKRGLDGYLYDTERVRQNLVGGFSSKGKKFQTRLYRLTALELGVRLFNEHSTNRGYIYNLLFGAANNVLSSIDHLAHILNWGCKFSPSPSRDPVPTRRLNEWAYEKARVNTQLIPLSETWDEVLNVKPTALWYEVKIAVRTLARIHHSDVGSEGADDFVMQRILAAYDVAKKIFNLR